MITIEEAIDIAGQLHHFQDIVDDIRVFEHEEPMTNDDPFLTFTTKSGRLTGFVDHRPFNGSHHVVSCLMYATAEKTHPFVKILVQNPNTTSAAARRAREEHANICYFMPYIAHKYPKAYWGCIENEKLTRNSTKIFDQNSVEAWKTAHPKPKKKRKASSSSSSSSASSSSSKKKIKIEKIDTPPLEPDLGPNFRLSVQDAVLIHDALHDPTYPKQVVLQSVHCVLKVCGRQKRSCVVVVDQARPKGYMKLMSQNKKKSSSYAARANEGELITWILPLRNDGRHTGASTWGVIENGVLNPKKNRGCPLSIVQ
jgi:hypothetical protein